MATKEEERKAAKEKMLSLVEKAKSFIIVCDDGEDERRGFHFGGCMSFNGVFDLLEMIEKKFPEVFLAYLLEKVAKKANAMSEKISDKKPNENPNKNKLM